jgi:hypothetical protein
METIKRLRLLGQGDNWTKFKDGVELTELDLVAV